MRVLSFGLFIYVLFWCGACSKVRLNRIEPPPPPPVQLSSKGLLCTRSPKEVNSKVKYLFIMDKSGSNTTTDPGAQLRAGGITEFWMENREDPRTEWSMLEFRGDGAVPFIGQQIAVFSADPADMANALQRLRGPDNGQTPYMAALTESRQAVLADIERTEGDQENIYMLFFVSDGCPTDTGGQALDCTGQIAAGRGQILEAVRNLKQSVTGRHKLYFSTAYYGSNGVGPQQLLQDMAMEGDGKYVNFNDAAQWDFSSLVVKPSVDPWNIKSLLVYNLNAGYCFDGSVDSDSDADGLCDKDEEELRDQGFDPQNRFSFGDGYGDLFHWRRLTFGITLPSCSDRSDMDFDLLTKCEENFVYNQNPPQGIPNSLDPLNPDTDGDGYLDGIEILVFFTRSLAFALDPFNMSKNILDGEAEDAGTQISQHRNPLLRDENAVRYDTDFKFQHFNDQGQSCYSFTQTQLTVYPTLEVGTAQTLPNLNHVENENVVYVHFIQTPQTDPNGVGVLMHSFQKLRYSVDNDNAASGLSVSDEIFDAYLTPTN